MLSTFTQAGDAIVSKLLTNIFLLRCFGIELGRSLSRWSDCFAFHFPPAIIDLELTGLGPSRSRERPREAGRDKRE